MRRYLLWGIACLLLVGCIPESMDPAAHSKDTRQFRLEELGLEFMTSGWGQPQPGSSIDGNPLTNRC